MNSNYHGDKIINLNENIQRVELLHMEEYFNSLKKSNLASVTSIYNQLIFERTLSLINIKDGQILSV